MNRRDFFMSSLAAALATSVASSRALAALEPVAGDIEAVTGGGGKVSLARTAVQELRDSLRGALLLPGQPGYDEARRVLNGSIDKHPALVVQPSGTADVRTAVSFAREHGLLLAVKCGGHSYAGKSTCDGGMQIDLSRFRGVRVDPLSRTAYVAGGSLLGELDHEAMALGLVTTAGTVSHTGVGGLTLGAGFGRPRQAIRPGARQRAGRRHRHRRWPTAARQRQARIPTCSGACVAAAETSAS